MPRINHNIPAMVTGNALRSVDRQMQKSLEKLSTGLRINRAADDAAGLSVSEQLRTQVRGLAMGDRNAQDGVSLVNIAEGALVELESMLQRMR
jgi:flagellin